MKSKDFGLRKVQGHSYSKFPWIFIPRKWARTNDIKPGDSVKVEGIGSKLIISKPERGVLTKHGENQK